MIARLFQEIEKIFAGDELEQKEEKRRSLQSSDNVGMRRKRLADCRLWISYCEKKIS